MQPYQTQQLENFLGAVRPLFHCYCSTTVRFLGLNRGDRYLVVAASISLDAEPLPQSEDFFFSDNGVVAGRVCTPFVEATFEKQLLALASSGDLETNGRELQLQTDADATVGLWFRPAGHAHAVGTSFAPQLDISGCGRHSLNVDWNAVDLSLNAASQPYQSVGELLGVLGLPTQLSDVCSVQIIARPVAAVSHGSKVEGLTAHLGVISSPNIKRSNLRLGWRSVSGPSVERGSACGPELQWADDAQACLLGTLSVPVKEHSICQCFVSYQGQMQHTWFVTDPSVNYNPRRVVHEAFDRGLEKLRELLFDFAKKDGESRKFEEGIAHLMHFAGFRTVHFDQPLDEAPDVIAFAGNGDVLLVECTTGALTSKGKLMKLVSRVQRVQNALSATFHVGKVIPVIVTLLPSSDVKAETAEALRLGIAVATREHIEQILEQVSLSTDCHLELAQRAYHATQPVETSNQLRLL